MPSLRQQRRICAVALFEIKTIIEMKYQQRDTDSDVLLNYLHSLARGAILRATGETHPRPPLKRKRKDFVVKNKSEAKGDL